MSHIDEVVPQFDNPREEADFWKKKYKEKQKELAELEESFNDFQTSSRDLEGEMEKELAIKEKKLEELQSQYRRLKTDYDDYVEKTRRNNDEGGKAISAMQEEVTRLKKLEKQYASDKQRLEQENDNLERKERQLTVSVEDLTKKLHSVMEENVVLQTEIDDYKSGSQESIQRLKDELRDMRLELSLLDRSKTADAQALANKLDRLADQISSSGNKAPKQNGVVTPVPSATDGITSIDLVEEMLNMVKDMESKISKNKKTAKEIATPAEVSEY